MLTLIDVNDIFLSVAGSMKPLPSGMRDATVSTRCRPSDVSAWF